MVLMRQCFVDTMFHRSYIYIDADQFDKKYNDSKKKKKRNSLLFWSFFFREIIMKRMITTNVTRYVEQENRSFN